MTTTCSALQAPGLLTARRSRRDRRSLPRPERRPQRHADPDQGDLPRSGARQPPRSPPRRCGQGGALQGGQRGVRDPLGPRAASRLRSAAPLRCAPSATTTVAGTAGSPVVLTATTSQSAGSLVVLTATAKMEGAPIESHHLRHQSGALSRARWSLPPRLMGNRGAAKGCGRSAGRC